MPVSDTLTSDSGFNAMLSSNPSDSKEPFNPNKSISGTSYRKGVSESIKEVDSAQKGLSSLSLAKPPALTSPPKESGFQTDPMQKFGSFGMVLATLGSLMTRKPLTNALKSGADVNDAISAGDATAFKTAYETWKSNNDNAWKMADWEQSNLKDLAQRFKDKEQGATERARLFGIATKNPSLETAAQIGQIQDYADSHARALRDAKTYQEKADLKHDLLEGSIDEYTQKNGKPPSKEEMAQFKLKADKEVEAKASPDTNSALPPDDPGIKFRIGLAATGDPSAFQNISRGKSGDTVRNAIWAGLAAEPNMTPEKLAALHLKFKSLISEEGTLGTQTAKLATAGEEFDRLADLAEESSEKVDRTKYPSLNKAIEAYDAGTGDTDVVGLVTNARGAVNTWARAVNPNGVATVEATTAGTHLLDVAYSKGQFSEALKQMRNETKAARAAPGAVQKSISDQVNPNGSSGNVAPEGTIIHDGTVTKIKQGGKWVTQ